MLFVPFRGETYEYVRVVEIIMYTFGTFGYILHLFINHINLPLYRVFH